MHVLIPAKGRSTRIANKNMQPLGDRPLVGWAIDKCRRWLPEAEVYVASEDREIRAYARSEDCRLYDLLRADVEDRRSVRELFTEFVRQFAAEQCLCLHPTSPFTFRSELFSALSRARPFTRSAWIGTLHTPSDLDGSGRPLLSQQLPERIVLTGNFLIARGPIANSGAWFERENLSPICWVSAIDINAPADLELARWMARYIRPEDLDE